MTMLYIALGSNLGDRAEHLHAALAALPAQGLRVTACSRFIETAPVGGPAGQGAYLNAVARAESELEPLAVLETLLKIERSQGRVRVPNERNAPRTLDLDLLLYGDLILNQADLTLPHPRLHQRAFVLDPLCELAPELLHPVFKKTLRELRAGLDQ